MKSQYCRAREPFSCYSHLIGAVLSAVGLVMLLVRAAREDAAPGTVLSVLLFGLSLVALYSASAVYHHALCGENALRVLKKLDHSMIYVLIAGSYTPIVLRYMEAPAAYIFLAVIWALAAFGIVVKLIWIDAPRLIGTLLYLLMGAASYLVAAAPVSAERKERALCVYALQLAVNLAWPVIFFKLSACGAAFFWLLLLLVLVWALRLLFKHIDPRAGKLLLPYLLWLLFALYLNLGVWILN